MKARTLYRKATPTEYRGVVYRSKCEAQVALLLDISAKSNGIIRQWWYEPAFLAVGDYVPDFLIHDLEFDCVEQTYLECWEIVEYKPAAVTETYRRQLAERFESIKKTPFVRGMTHAFGDSAVSFQLWEGSVYAGCNDTWVLVGYGEDVPKCIKQPFDDSLVGPWMDDEDINEIKRHRFDLVSR